MAHETLDWRSRPLQNMNAACEIAGLSAASLYRAQAEGRLEFKRLGGRTMVPTDSLIRFMESAEPWTPSQQGAAARAKRSARAAQNWMS
ncbi:hypothetical protein SAMN02983003_3873 [Devosia enhydra]|uniref:Helix-turn-helix domain-containing protein n=1 Tax=Devosia enhydra TaxID=665118 RepID=A0A1K2I371_9HYPH|nr:helix-turn-helix domain-containing protein [Devosia enhydra]SFZ86679.1 hypothetical protein SAMN02983003_3873 [Devosia enhydra]